MSSSFATAPGIVYGTGSLSELGRLAAEMASSALLVTGGGSLRAAGVVDRASGLLAAEGVRFTEFEGVGADPDLETVDAVRDTVRESGAECVISVGGGSVIDAAKAAAGLAAESAPAAEFQAGREVGLRGLPHVAVPTTAGTGAEVTPNAVITDPSVPAKKSIRDPSFMPAVALVDAELLVTLPPRQTAESGMDALVQAIESASSIHATELTRALSIRSAALVAGGLAGSVADGSDLAARQKCATGSLMAGMALANARLGVVHGLAHPLGARYGLAHGLVCGVLLPHALRLNAAAAAEAYGMIERACRVEGFAGDSAGERLAAWAESLLERVGLPGDLSDAGISPEDFDRIAAESMGSGSLKANALKVEPPHLRRILEAAC